MQKAICNSIGSCHLCEGCGAAKLHSGHLCEGCPVNKEAKCEMVFLFVINSDGKSVRYVNETPKPKAGFFNFMDPKQEKEYNNLKADWESEERKVKDYFIDLTEPSEGCLALRKKICGLDTDMIIRIISGSYWFGYFNADNSVKLIEQKPVEIPN